MARSNNFDDASDHDWGVMIFAGDVFEWRIEYRGKQAQASRPILPIRTRPSVSLPST